MLTSVSFESDHLFFYVFCSLPGHESPSGSRCVISEFIRPLQISGDKPEQLSVKPTFLSKSRSDTPRCRFDSDVSLLKFLAGNTWCGARICLLWRLMQDHPPTFKKKRHEIHIFWDKLCMWPVGISLRFSESWNSMDVSKAYPQVNTYVSLPRWNVGELTAFWIGCKKKKKKKKAAQISQIRKGSLTMRFREAELTTETEEVHVKFNSIFLLFLSYLTENVKTSFAVLFIACLLECNYVMHAHIM